MTKIYCLILILFLSTSMHAQTSSPQDTLSFKPTGTVIAKGFLDYSMGLGNAEHVRGFNIGRAFLGYNYKFTPTWQAQLVLDGASYQSPISGTDANTVNMYVRNAFVNWRDNGFNINFGLLGLLEYNLQETYWGHRYVEKSYQDLNNMGPSVDLGITAEYAFNPMFSVDVSFTNGQGIRKIQKSTSARYALGITAKPIKGLVLRAYGDIYNESEDLRDKLPEGVTGVNFKDKYITALFVGYQNKKVSLGAEYNHLYNLGFIEKKDYHGFSFYSSVKLSPKYGIYGRYDLTESSQADNYPNSWNKLDGQLMILGFEYQPAKQLKISPNIRNVNPTRGKSEQYFAISVDFSI